MFRKIHIFFVTFLYITANILQADQFDETPYCNKSWGEFSLRGDFLYWKPHVSCLELDCGSGIITQTITDGTQVVTSSEFDIDPSGKWNGGYRVAAGYRFANPQWEIEAIWTDFHGKACRSSQESPSISNETKYCVNNNFVDINT